MQVMVAEPEHSLPLFSLGCSSFIPTLQLLSCTSSVEWVQSAGVCGSLPTHNLVVQVLMKGVWVGNDVVTVSNMPLMG